MSRDLSFPKHLIKLARLFRVERSYYNMLGERCVCSKDALFKVVRAMGIAIKNDDDAPRVFSEWRMRLLERVAPPVIVAACDKDRACKNGIASIILTLPSFLNGETDISWTFSYEDGHHIKGINKLGELKCVRRISHNGDEYSRYQFQLQQEMPLGYHLLIFVIEGTEYAVRVIVVPEMSYQLPNDTGDDRKHWGLTAQLYSLQSGDNWGIGQFTDISRLLNLVEDGGGSFIGLNPFNAVSMFNSSQNSPYSATSRCFLNTYYLDCETMPDVLESPDAQALVASPEFREKIEALRQATLVQYSDVRALKNLVFELAYEHFRSTHMAFNTERAKDFYEFTGKGGRLLEAYAIYEVIGALAWKPDGSCWGWPVWKKEYVDVRSAAVTEFAAKHRDEIDYFKFLQWQAFRQLEQVVRQCQESTLSIGLYVDFALSADKGGCDVWRDKKCYALTVGVGAPPDDYNPKGQNWGFAPPIPFALYDSGYQPFVEALKANMHFAGAIRIDHAMSLMRLFWIPDGEEAGKGVYVHYNYRDLMGIVCLESVRNKCVVVCEDLGTVPDAFRVVMSNCGMLSYKVFFFMKNAPINFCSHRDYPKDALVTGTTHDMHTLWGYWKGLDLKLRDSLQLLTGAPLDDQLVTREHEKRNIINLLKSEHILPEKYDVEAGLLELDDKVLVGIEQFLARTPAKLLAIPIEDIAGQEPQVNLPGTTGMTYSSWSYRLPMDVEQIGWLTRFQALKKALKVENRA